MSQIKAVIFDWAGTTVDYGCFAPVGAFIEAFQHVGIEPTLAEVRAPMGMLKREHIRTMLSMPRIAAAWLALHGKAFTDADLDVMYADYEKILLASLSAYTDPKPHVLACIQTLRARGIQIGSTTGYTDKMMALVVPAAASKGYAPDFWCSPDAVGGQGRPFPFMLFENMRALGILSTAEVVKVGDTVSDIQEGKNAGVYTIGVIEGSSEMGLTQAEFEALSTAARQEKIEAVRAVYLKHGADATILNMSELLAHIN